MLRFLILILFPTILFSKENSHPHRIRVGPDFDEKYGFQISNEYNLYQGAFYTNVFLEYEKEDLSLGAYFNNIPLKFWGNYTQTYAYDSYLGFNKSFKLVDKVKLNIGSQSGTQLTNGSKQFLNIESMQLMYSINKLDISVGTYYANNPLSNRGNRIGETITIAYKIIPSVMWMTFDWYSGNTNLSGSIINLYYNNIYFGIQVPATNSGNEFAGNIGINCPLPSKTY